MNHKKLIYGFLVLSATVGSCSKMEEEPYGIINSVSFYKTAVDAQAAIVYAYAILPEVGYYGREYYLTTELPTEELTQKGDAGASNLEMDAMNPSNTNTDLDNIWRYAYRGIARANAVIVNVPKIPNMDKATQDQIVGEGHFLRALHNFNLVRLFGEIPLRAETIEDVSQIPMGKSPVKDVYDLIIADLKKAEELITKPKIVEGRAGKVAAQALLSKVYLTIASSKATGAPGYDFVTSADEMYTQAKSYSGKVVNEQSAYGFTNTLVDIWNISLYKQQSAVTEHIFDAAVDRSGDREGSFTKLPNMFLNSDRPMTVAYNPSDPASPTINIGQGWNHFWTEPTIYNSYEATDKRKSDLIVSKYTNSGTTYNLDIASTSRPFTRKFIDPDRIGDAQSSNSPIIRFSDILLVFAEACGPTADGYNAINKIRTRAGLGELTPGLSAELFRDAVLQERSWELTFEGHRLFDLRRTNSIDRILVQKYKKTVNPQYAYFFPIPLRELQTNPLIIP